MDVAKPFRDRQIRLRFERAQLHQWSANAVARDRVTRYGVRRTPLLLRWWTGATDATSLRTGGLMLAFRLTAVSDERRESLISLGFNLGTGAVIGDILARMRPTLAQTADWHIPDMATKRAAGPGWSSATLAGRLRRLLEREARDSMEPFLRAMRRRLERDRDRIHAYHNDLRDASLKRLAALDGADGNRADADRRRETLRVEAIEREYRAKLDDLRR
jgi:hypothetical protein